MTIPGKPKWPYRNETVLTPSGNGQWVKKHKGKTYYFGPVNDPMSALLRWRAQWPAIVAGIPLKVVGSGVTLKDACTHFMSNRIADWQKGDLAWPTVQDFRYVCKRLVKHIGPDRRLDTIGPRDFEKVSKSAAALSPTTRSKLVISTRAIFEWFEGNYGAKVEFGPDFRTPPKKAIRKQLNERPDKTLEPEQIHDLLAVASDQLRAMILLGINGGYGNSDISALPTSAVDLDNAVIDYYRHKTQAKRRVPLWPETIEAVRKVIVPGQELLFLDRYKKPMVRRGVNAVCRMMEEVRVASGVQATFYCLRYTFATKAAEIRDDHARMIIMGHVIDGVSENYVLRFPMDALKRLTDHVHDWLYGVKTGQPGQSPLAQIGGATGGVRYGQISAN